MRLTLGFSPCPNDTFIFDALVNKKIDTGHLDFEVVLEDVQTLNEWAKEGRLDITKISYAVLPLVQDRYTLLSSGGALGKGVGPLLIARPGIDKALVPGLKIAIPGKDTTAHLLFRMAFPGAVHKKFMVFHEIENAVLNGEADAGVIIHENRFTYQQKGLMKIMDLGEYWEEQMGVPIPLGAIIASNHLDETVVKKTETLIRKSLEFAFQNYPSIPDYVKHHSQEMSEEVMKKHIDLYVNDYSLDLGAEGRKAVQCLLKPGIATSE